MNCQECRDYIDPYFDSELDAGDAIQVAHHLRDRAECRHRLRSLSRNGYNIINWKRAGFDWWAVSDVSAADLDPKVEDEEEYEDEFQKNCEKVS